MEKDLDFEGALECVDNMSEICDASKKEIKELLSILGRKEVPIEDRSLNRLKDIIEFLRKNVCGVGSKTSWGDWGSELVEFSSRSGDTFINLYARPTTFREKGISVRKIYD